jgi:hypothetical protein
LAPPFAALIVVAVRTVFARNEQDHPRAHRQRLRDAAIEAVVRLTKRHAMEVDGHVGIDGATRELAVPGGIEAIGRERTDGGCDQLGHWAR